MTFEELLLLSNKDAEKRFKNKNVKILTKDGCEVCFFVKAFMLAANPPHWLVGFITDEDKQFDIYKIASIETL